MEYKLVPVEPTDDQIDAAHSDLDAWRRIHGQYLLSDAEVFTLYNSMLAAAPSPAWIETAERLPTREDADERGNVWCAHRHGWGVGQHPYSWVHDSTQSHWMPKPRQQPPAPPAEKEGE